MSDLFILYVVVTYLVYIGFASNVWTYSNKFEKTGLIICTILSPVFLPYLLGIKLCKA